MRPVSVTVTNTEAGEAIAAPGTTLEFWEFEARARAAAEAHTGCYLKTWIVVTFDTGDTYECRIDLGNGYRMPKGFQDHIALSTSYHESAEGQERLIGGMPPEMAENRRELHAQWVRMDFTKPGVMHVADAGSGMIRFECSTCGHDTGWIEETGTVEENRKGRPCPSCAPKPSTFATEPTRAGLQYVMPGCEKRTPERQGAQGVLF